MTELNDRAWRSVNEMIAVADALGVSVEKMVCGTRVIDAGVHSPGSMGAGLALAQICTAGLGEFRLEMADLVGHPWLWVTAASDQPLIACFLSQAAHWQVKIGAFRAMGSGPACLLNKEVEVGRLFNVEERADQAVLVLETRQLPEDRTCRELSEICGVAPSQLSLLVAPTASLAGSTQIAARSIETALHKLHHLGFDLRHVVYAAGRCPVAIPTGDDLISMGRTNDLVIFASQVWLGIAGVPDDILAAVAENIPANASPDYGRSFSMILSQAGSFYDVDPGLFAPAEITLSSVDSGRSFHFGSCNEQIIRQVLDVNHPK